MEKQGSLIIMGDFNNEAKRIGEGYDLVKNSSLGLYDAFILAKDRYGENTVEKEIDGWSGNDAKLRIDYILYLIITRLKATILFLMEITSL